MMLRGVSPTTLEQQELFALRLSSFLTAAFAALGIGVAIRTRSETMMFEALSGIADVIVTSLGVFVIRRVHEPANTRYHFGYAKYEPLMTAVEGILITAVCVGAITHSIRDLVHPHPVANPTWVILYALTSFVISVGFGLWSRRVGGRTASSLVLAGAELWIVEGWLSFGVFVAFAVSEMLTTPKTLAYSAYVDPAVCIILSLIFLRKPVDVLKESVAELVDANPYADCVNAFEESARACGERFQLKGLEGVRLRKAGRRVFVLVSFFDDPNKSLAGMDRVREAVTNEMQRLNPHVDVCVSFRTK